MHHTTRRSLAFTLIELVIALLVVSLLAGIALPVVATVRRRSAVSTCAHNLRQLHAAFAMYAADNDGMLPFCNNRLDLGDYVGGVTTPRRDESHALVHCLQPYTHGGDIWFCPEDSAARRDVRKGDINHCYTSYAYAAAVPPYLRRPPVRFDLPHYQVGVSTVMLLTDNVWECKNNDLWRDSSEYSHSGMFNGLYFDGHMRVFRLTDEGCGLSAP